MGDATRFLIVRHGESTWNAVGRWQGQADPPLSDLGERQAARAAETVVEHGPFDGVVTSSLQRAHRTAEVLAGGAALELHEPDAALIERYAGGWQGLTRREIESHFPGWLRAGRRPDDYEDDASIVERVSAALGAVAERSPGGRFVVVSHGGIVNALERGADEPWRRLGNLEGRWFVHTDGVLTPTGDRVQLLDDVAEVAGSTPAVPDGYA